MSQLTSIFKTRTVGSLKEPDSGFLRSIFSNDTDTGVPMDNFKAYNYTAYWRAIMLISNDISRINKHILRRNDRNGTEEVFDELAYLLCKNPNQNQTQSQFYGLMTSHLVNWGNSYAVIKRDRAGNPIGIYPKMPWETTIYTTTETDPKERVKVFAFSDEEQAFFPDEDVIHIFRMSKDGLQGMNPLVYAARNSISLGVVAEKYSSKFFANGGRGNAVIELKEAGISIGDEEDADDSEVAKMRQSWESTYANSGSFFKTMFLEEGETYKPVNTPPEALQLLNTRIFQIGEIARLVGIPEYKLGSKEPKHNNIEQQAIEYVSESLDPIARLFADEFSKKLMPRDSIDMFKMDTEQLITADIKTRYEAYNIGLGRNAPGFLSKKYIQDKERLEHFPDEETWVPMNMVRQSDAIQNPNNDNNE